MSSDQGAKRKEYVATHIDTLTLNDRSASKKSIKLNLPQNIGDGDLNVSIGLVERQSKSKVSIPVGSIIDSVEIRICKPIDDGVVIVCGFFSDLVIDGTRRANLLSRVCGVSNPVTGALLNRHKRIRFCQQLNESAVVAQNTLYTAERQSRQLTVNPLPDYGVMGSNQVATDGSISISNVCVGESELLYPALTILKGVVPMDAIEVCIIFSHNN